MKVKSIELSDNARNTARAYASGGQVYCELPDGSSGFWIEDNADKGMIQREVERRARLVGPWQVIWTVLERKHQEHIKQRRIGLADSQGKLVATAVNIKAGRVVEKDGVYYTARPLSSFHERGERKAMFYKRVDALPLLDVTRNGC